MQPNTTTRENIIYNYISGYNQFNINQMIQDLDDKVVFENIQNGEVTMALSGPEAFKKQAEQAATYFTSRTQTISSIKHLDEVTTIDIDYAAILSQDLPNGLKKGQELNLTGKSIFEFSGDRIIKITDIS